MNPYHRGFSSAEMEPEGYEPVATSFYGLRVWVVDSGTSVEQLVGARSGMPWAHMPSTAQPDPGPGVPECGQLMPATARRGGLRSVYRSAYLWGPGINTASCLRNTTTQGRVEEHDPVFAQCECGFWAFTAGQHAMTIRGPSVMGVIQGWGRMVIGPHGFRAQKARIVALCMQLEHPYRQAESRSSVWPRRHNGRPPTAVTNPRYGFDDVRDHVDRDLGAAIRANYPGVEIYETNADMQRAWPLSDLSELLPPDTEERG